MRIDKIHSFINDLLDKEQKGYHSPEQIDAALDFGQMRVLAHYLPLYAISAEAVVALEPFKKSIVFGTDGNGVYAIPGSEGYQGLIGFGITYNESGTIRAKGVKFLGEDELDNRLNSQLRKPTLTNPVGEITGLGAFKLYPAGVYAGGVRFIRRPVAPKLAYTYANRVLTYDDTASKQLEWAELYQPKVIQAALVYLGVNMGDDGVIQISEALSKLN